VTYNDQQKISILESTNTQVIPSREDGEGARLRSWRLTRY